MALLGDIGTRKVLQNGTEASDEGKIKGAEMLDESNIGGVRMVMQQRSHRIRPESYSCYVLHDDFLIDI